MPTIDATDSTSSTDPHARMLAALGAEDTSTRLRAALAAGTNPDPAHLEALVERCAVEPDFFVRDMLSWALLRLPRELTLPRIRVELTSTRTQARSQAIHTLSKIAEPGTWAWITDDLLHDTHDEIARTAWRTAVVLVPDDERAALAQELARELGRGDREVRLSLSRCLVDLGHAAALALDRAAHHPNPDVTLHARATVLLGQQPETGFDAAVEEAKRGVTLGPESAAGDALEAAGSIGPIEGEGGAQPGC